MEMKSNFKLPDVNDHLFDKIDYVELNRDACLKLVERYVHYELSSERKAVR